MRRPGDETEWKIISRDNGETAKTAVGFFWKAGLVGFGVRCRRKKQEHTDGVKKKPRSWIALAFAAVVLAKLIVFAFTATG